MVRCRRTRDRRAQLVLFFDIEERMPTVMPVKGSCSDLGGGEVKVAMEPGASDSAEVLILWIPVSEVEDVAFVWAERWWPCIAECENGVVMGVGRCSKDTFLWLF